MSKRFTDTDLWKSQRWFRKLSPYDKLAFCYIKDQCSHAGIWKIDCSDLIDDLGLDGFELTEFISAINVEFDKITGKKITKERLRIIDGNLLWITGFIQFQCHGKDGKVNFEVAPVRTAMVALEGLGILGEALNKGYLTLAKPLLEGWQRGKEKEKDKDKVFETNGGAGEEETLTQKNTNGKRISNFKAQGENTMLERIGKHTKTQ